MRQCSRGLKATALAGRHVGTLKLQFHTLASKTLLRWGHCGTYSPGPTEGHVRAVGDTWHVPRSAGDGSSDHFLFTGHF